ncbi:putative molybdenum carrier protein [Pannus brasiliensis CCIBt3594]|uniref:Molybdenum carrier protein n=1 Tax=Pannus brasiliensis CCIBt3594 TaxID=1427578 RepID=A0AAW9QSN8_9CHRO
MKLRKIVSGGQTGADRAGLDHAIDRGIPHGGWCPRGRRAEDGAIDPRYELRETPSADPAVRTEWNVRDSDGTAIFCIHYPLTGGTLLTERFARQYGKPCLILCKTLPDGDRSAKLRKFIGEHRIEILNIAGPRASSEPDLDRFVREILDRL